MPVAFISRSLMPLVVKARPERVGGGIRPLAAGRERRLRGGLSFCEKSHMNPLADRRRALIAMSLMASLSALCGSMAAVLGCTFGIA